ncbi:MAG TPA: carboxypeptidase-like regulatory domain-containing protein [Candidatus Acidoferrales bacterium]|nr:carboxypeptidase-like regulatory domain-containing protein [Candidatus Acidoferrales bacterium]
MTRVRLRWHPGAPGRSFLSRRSSSRAILALLFFTLFSLPAAAGTLTGVVTNGTTGKPVPHADVTLISLAGGMQELTTTQTDADGRYRFERPEIGQGPMLIRVTYQKVNYHQAGPPGRDTVDLTVFEANAPATAAHVTMRTIIFQPNGPRLMVGEEFVVENRVAPPATYSNPKGSFEFGIPEGASLGQVSASSPGGMPTTQGTIDKAKNRYAVDFPLKPGETNIRISYDLPYTGDHATLRAATVMPAARAMLAAPVGVQISADGFNPAGNDQGFTLLTREDLAAGANFAVTLSGAASVQAQAQPQGQPPERGQGAGGGGGAPPAENIQVLPSRISSFQWIVLGGMGLFFLGGFFFLMRQQRAIPVTPNGTFAAAAPPVSAGKKSRARDHSAERSAHAQPAHSAPVAAGIEDAGRPAPSGRMNLEELKETLFRLEFRRHAGTITEQEYALERSRVEAAIRDFVRG